MTSSDRYLPGPDKPHSEVLHDSHGRLADDAYVDSAVDGARKVARGPGRPSLSTSGESPLLRVRLSADLVDAVTRAADAAGSTRAESVRCIPDKAVRHAG